MQRDCIGLYKKMWYQTKRLFMIILVITWTSAGRHTFVLLVNHKSSSNIRLLLLILPRLPHSHMIGIHVSPCHWDIYKVTDQLYSIHITFMPPVNESHCLCSHKFWSHQYSNSYIDESYPPNMEYEHFQRKKKLVLNLTNGCSCVCDEIFQDILSYHGWSVCVNWISSIVINLT